tara:strand:+ start:517 stop:729 length:213 start_codon:yes stop_codon:yes gene_type:complete
VIAQIQNIILNSIGKNNIRLTTLKINISFSVRVSFKNIIFGHTIIQYDSKIIGTRVPKIILENIFDKIII